MSTILEYQCGCRYFSNLKTIEALHLCTEHKIQVANDAMNELMTKERQNEI